MGAHNFNDLKAHIGHKINCVSYDKGTTKSGAKNIFNVAIECETCQEVLMDFDRIN